MWSSFDPALLHHPAEMVLFVLAYAVAEMLLLTSSAACHGPGRQRLQPDAGVVPGSAPGIHGSCGGIHAGAVLAATQASRWLERSRHLKVLQQVVSQEGLRVLLLARLSPVLPFNLLNLAYSLSDIQSLILGLGLFGTVPVMMLYLGLGSAVADPQVGAGSLHMIGVLAKLACARLLARRLLPGSAPAQSMDDP